MSKNFALVQAPISEMTTAQLRDWLEDLPDSEVMRSVLMAEVTAIRKDEPREQRTLRGLWYSLVKPVLSRAGLLNKKTNTGKDLGWDRKLSCYLAELVRSGETTYAEMKIIDGSRQRQTAQEYTTSVMNVQLVGAHHPWIILFIEKDTTWPVVKNLADLYGVSAISGGGEPAFSCTEDIVIRIIKSAAADRMRKIGDYPLPFTLLSITDFDPAGYTIANAQAKQIKEILGSNITHTRLGVEPDQLTPKEREDNAYQLKDQNSNDWFEETGGVDGELLGIELDALPLSRLRRMYAEAIERHIDIEFRREDLREAFVDLVACDLLEPEMHSRREAMIEAVKKDSCWTAIQGRDLIPEDLFMQAAVEGQDWITPSETKDLFSKHLAQVQQIMRDALTRL